MTHAAPRRGIEPELDRMARRHIFILDAEPALLDLVRELLGQEQYNVTTSNFVPSTQAVIAVLQPDLVIVDLVWGQRAGWDLLESLTREASTAGIPVLLLSTDQRLLDDAAADPARFGAHHELVKPFDIDALTQTVRDLAGPA